MVKTLDTPAYPTVVDTPQLASRATLVLNSAQQAGEAPSSHTMCHTTCACVIQHHIHCGYAVYCKIKRSEHIARRACTIEHNTKPAERSAHANATNGIVAGIESNAGDPKCIRVAALTARTPLRNVLPGCALTRNRQAVCALVPLCVKDRPNWRPQLFQLPARVDRAEMTCRLEVHERRAVGLEQVRGSRRRRRRRRHEVNLHRVVARREMRRWRWSVRPAAWSLRNASVDRPECRSTSRQGHVGNL